MKFFLSFLFLFLFGSMLGYIIEVFFRRFVSMKKWINPGFMKGPWLPIYGFGICFLFVFYNLFTWCNVDLNPGLAAFLSILLFTIAATLIEYIAGIIFIKGMNVKLWDYSNMKGNIQGIICPEFTFLWMVAGIFYYTLLGAPLNTLFDNVYTFMFVNNHFGAVFSLGLAYGMMLLDFLYSANFFSKVSSFAKENKLYVGYELLKIEVAQKKISIKNKSDLSLAIASYIEKTKEKTAIPLSNFKKIFLIDPNKKKKKEN